MPGGDAYIYYWTSDPTLNSLLKKMHDRKGVNPLVPDEALYVLQRKAQKLVKDRDRDRANLLLKELHRVAYYRSGDFDSKQPEDERFYFLLEMLEEINPNVQGVPEKFSEASPFFAEM